MSGDSWFTHTLMSERQGAGRCLPSFNLICHASFNSFFFFSWPYLFTYFSLFGCEACVISVPWSWVEPVNSVMEAWSLNHWTSRAVPAMPLYFKGLTTHYNLVETSPSWPTLVRKVQFINGKPSNFSSGLW